MTKYEIELLDAALSNTHAVSRSRPTKQRKTHFAETAGAFKGPNLSIHYRNKSTGLNTFQMMSSATTKNRADGSKQYQRSNWTASLQGSDTSPAN